MTSAPEDYDGVAIVASGLISLAGPLGESTFCRLISREFDRAGSQSDFADFDNANDALRGSDDDREFALRWMRRALATVPIWRAI